MEIGAGVKLAAEVLGRALLFGLIYAAQRTLGPAAYGHFTYALALGAVLAPLTDLGVQLTVARELARGGADRARIAGAGLTVKLALAVPVCVLLVAASATRPREIAAVTFALGLAVVATAFVEFLGYVFRGLQRVESDALINLLARALTVALGLALLWRGAGLPGLAAAYLLASGSAAVVGLVWLRRAFFAPRLAEAARPAIALLGGALPLGGAILVSIAYSRTAVFVLDAWQGAEAVGAFGVAQKLVEPLSLVPAALMAAVFPAFTRALGRDAGESRRLRARTLAMLAAAGCATSVIGVLGGPLLVRALYGEMYAASAAPLQILALSIAPVFLNYALTHFLIACGEQARYLRLTAIVFVVNAALSVALVPRFGPPGAAAAVLASELLLLALCLGAPRGDRRAPLAPIEPTLLRFE